MILTAGAVAVLPSYLILLADHSTLLICVYRILCASLLLPRRDSSSVQQLSVVQILQRIENKTSLSPLGSHSSMSAR